MAVVVAHAGAKLLGYKVLWVGIIRAPDADVHTEGGRVFGLVGRGGQIIIELGKLFGVDLNIDAQVFLPHLFQRSRDLGVVRVLVIDGAPLGML